VIKIRICKIGYLLLLIPNQQNTKYMSSRSFKIRKFKGAFFKTPAVKAFLAKANKYPPLSREDEYALFEEYRAGSEAAKDKIVRHNMRFVVTVATHTCSRPEDIADAIGVGCIGLLTAVERHDHTRGIKLISYAVWYIKQQILEQTHNSQVVREKVMKADDKDGLELMYQGYSDSEVMEKTGLIESRLRLLKVSKIHVSSLDVPINAELGEATLSENVESNLDAPDSFIIAEGNSALIQEALSKLTDKERTIIKMTYGFDGMMQGTLKDIGEALGLSRERVRQLTPRILKKLKRFLSQTQ
jgi:RNA polymerase primary sigma factor